jgi:hypothetical protein
VRLHRCLPGTGPGDQGHAQALPGPKIPAGLQSAFVVPCVIATNSKLQKKSVLCSEGL